MTTVKRARLSSAQRRAQLVALGREAARTGRLEELSVDEIASAAGISRGLLFHYFGSLQEFQLAIAAEVAAEYLSAIEPDPSLDPLGQLSDSLRRTLDWVSLNSQTYIGLLRGAASVDRQMRELVEATRAANASRILAGLGSEAAASAQGAIAVVPPGVELAVQCWITFAEEAIVRWLRARHLDDDLAAGTGGAARGFDRDELTGWLVQSLVGLVAGVSGFTSA